MSPFTGSCRGDARVVVNDVRPEGDVDGDRNTSEVGLQQNTVLSERRPKLCKPLSHRFSDPQAVCHAVIDRLVNAKTSLLGHSECSLFQLDIHVFAGRADKRKFEVVYHARSVKRHGSDKAAVHEIDYNRREAGLDDMTSKTPEYG